MVQPDTELQFNCKPLENIREMHFPCQRLLGVSGSCRTRIPESSYPRVDRTHVVAFMRKWEPLGTHDSCLGVPPTTVEQAGITDINFRRAAGASGNQSYYLLWNEFKNSCFQYAFPSLHLYLCSYTATHIYRVHLEELQGMHQCNSKCIWRWPSNDLGDALGGCDQVSFEMHMEAMIEPEWWWTWTLWSYKPGNSTWPMLPINISSKIGQTWSVWSSGLGVRGSPITMSMVLESLMGYVLHGLGHVMCITPTLGCISKLDNHNYL